jgi:predicted acyltransferase
VQPAFMTIAGTAMYLSYFQKSKKGITWAQNFKHIANRCLKLFFLGVLLHCIHAGHPVWELWDVLIQLAVTSLIAYLIIRKSTGFQLVVSILLILLTDLLYRFVAIPGFDQPYTKLYNFGAYMDTLMMGKINPSGWVAINFIPTAAHTIWGVLIGKLLLCEKPIRTKLMILLMTGFSFLAIGYGLDALNIIPIIKRICTGSFVYVSGGWIILIFTALYWLIDVKKNYQWTWLATIVGMNAIFIYLFFESIGMQWLNPTMGIFIKGFGGLLQLSEPVQNVANSLVVLTAEWYLCFWLFKKKIFFKI